VIGWSGALAPVQVAGEFWWRSRRGAPPPTQRTLCRRWRRPSEQPCNRTAAFTGIEPLSV
jgi:hypothetical protein